MSAITCPFEGCTYSVPAGVDGSVVVQLLQMHGTSAHPRPSVSITADKVSRPRITPAGSSEDWAYFKTRWADYKDATHLTGRDCVMQLLECCDETLRRDLTRSAGGSLADKSEEDVLTAMRRLAVREENIMVARVALHQMTQDANEPIRAFAARLRGQADVCNFTIICPNEACKTEVSYLDEVLRDVIARGISDSEIQLDLLGEQNRHMMLEEIISFIEAKESGKRSAQRLLQSQGVAAARSQYRRAKTQPQPDVKRQNWSANTAEKCQYCGRGGHGTRASPEIRAASCPAFRSTCRNCRRRGHFAEVCRQKKTSYIATAGDDEAAGFEDDAPYDALCSVIEGVKSHVADIEPKIHTASSCTMTLGHHTYDDGKKCWRRKPSQPQPSIELELSLNPDDYADLGIECTARPATVPQDAVADTGCQSCLAGTNLLRRLGITETDLVPTSMRMHAANGNTIDIRGAVVLRIAGQHDSIRRETRQFVYITPSTETMYLSRDACSALGMIVATFPSIGSASAVAAGVPAGDGEPCSCPRRQPPPPVPNELPMEATDETAEDLGKWLIDYYASSAFNTCVHQPLTKMDSPPLRLMVNNDAEPVACHKAIPVPLHWQAEVKEALDRDVQLGVIEAVPVGEPVTWCHRMVVVAKKNGKPRRCVDFQALNRHATRETHHTPSPFHQARSVPGSQYKTVLDAWNGYHSVPLHPDDRHLTTFLTPWGRYRYRVAPQGYVSSGDGYTRRYDEIILSTGLSHNCYTKCVDDALIWGDTVADIFWRTVEWLDMCGRHGITLNAEKFRFAQRTVEFAGFEITQDAVRPCYAFIQSIADFPIPQNLTDVRAWFGVINHVSYAFAMADVMLPYRDLLKPGKFEWTEELQALFEESKRVVIDEITKGVQIFEMNRPTVLATDWSRTGIGFWLLQKHCQCMGRSPLCCAEGWKTTLVGSRFTSGAESRYAPVEGEALAVADALEKARFFVLGCQDLTVVVDHKPLIKILGDRSLVDIPNARLRNLKEKTLRFKFDIKYIPGVHNRVPDVTSRYPAGAPVGMPLQDDATTDESGRVAAAAIGTIRSVTWDRVREATASDTTMHQLMGMVEDGIPEHRHEMSEELREYHGVRDGLYTSDGVVLYDQRVVIPPSLRSEVLQSLHGAHQGMGMMLARAAVSVYWPGITADIRLTREQCGQCNRNAPSQPSAPPEDVCLPAYPFQMVCADYFSYMGQTYLVVVDRYSNWPIVEKAAGGSKGLITCLRRAFVTFGIADELTSDGGPEFTAKDTQEFLDAWGVRHRRSSVAFPHANCRAEVGVKTVKRLIEGNTGPNGELDVDKFQRAILTYRNAPDPVTKLSPAQCVFGRPVRDFVPIPPGRYNPHTTWKETLVAREEALRNRHMLAHERWSEHTKRLPPLKVGEAVRLQNQTGRFSNKWDKTGRVVEVRQHNQYAVCIDGSGRVSLRNRKFLRKYTPVVPKPRGNTQLDDVLEKLRKRPAQLQSPRTTSQVQTKPPLSTTEMPQAQAVPDQAPPIPRQQPPSMQQAPPAPPQVAPTPAQLPPVFQQHPAVSSRTPRTVPLQTPHTVSPQLSRTVSPPKSRVVWSQRPYAVSPREARGVSPQRSRKVFAPQSSTVSQPQSRTVSPPQSRTVSQQKSHTASRHPNMSPTGGPEPLRRSSRPGATKPPGYYRD